MKVLRPSDRNPKLASCGIINDTLATFQTFGNLAGLVYCKLSQTSPRGLSRLSDGKSLGADHRRFGRSHEQKIG